MKVVTVYNHPNDLQRQGMLKTANIIIGKLHLIYPYLQFIVWFNPGNCRVITSVVLKGTTFSSCNVSFITEVIVPTELEYHSFIFPVVTNKKSDGSSRLMLKLKKSNCYMFTSRWNPWMMS